MNQKQLTINDHHKIAYFERLSNQSRIAMIIVHGLAEHKGRYIEFIDNLHSLGYSVFAPDLIGHGESSGARGDIKNFSEYLDHLKAFIIKIKTDHPQLKIVLFGHSLGGLIAGSYAATYQDIDLLILSNPLLERRKIFNILNFLPYKLLSFIKIKKRTSESKTMLEYSRKDPLSCQCITLRLAGEILITGINYLSRRFHNIKTPLLLLVGSEDRVLKYQDYPRLIKYFGSPDKTLKIYQDIKHRLVHSPKKEEIIKDISTWINNKIHKSRS